MLQLEKLFFVVGGESVELVCNMAALEQLQELHGSMEDVFKTNSHQIAVELFEIMVNRARKKRGLEPLTHEAIMEEISPAMLEDAGILDMFFRAMDAGKAREHAEKNEKN